MSSQKDEMAKDGDDELMMVDGRSDVLDIARVLVTLAVLSEDVDGPRDSKDVLAIHCAKIGKDRQRCVTNNKIYVMQLHASPSQWSISGSALLQCKIESYYERRI